MRGFPRTLNSRADYEYVQKHFPKECWLPHFQGLLETVRDWFFVKELQSEAEGVTDATHKVVKDESQGTFAQYELQVNPQCKLLRLGYTEDEVRKIVEEA